MTRADFQDWLKVHRCTFELLNEHRLANAIKVVNKDGTGHVFLDLPINDKPLKEFYVCDCCIKLKIPIPDFGKNSAPLCLHLKDKFSARK